MKQYFLGIDGGGTKTACLLVNEEGILVSYSKTSGSSYRELGVERVVLLMQKLVDQCLLQAGIDREELAGTVIGLPCFGESKDMDVVIEKELCAIFKPGYCRITNDVEVGWAGSLALKTGVHIVSGTGSIAYGKNAAGEAARSGGWSSFFGDEGSCYQLGRKMMELFSKQADQRVEKGALYDLVMDHFGLKDAMDFIDLMELQYIPDRDQVAALQRLLLQAARNGDQEAVKLYEQAAVELSLMVKGVVHQLKLWNQPFYVSYSGGLFHAQELVQTRLSQEIDKMGGKLIPPRMEPVQGAALLAASLFSDCDLGKMEENLKKMVL
jgi:N-acetylglucosamine kinase-like BadF-type ATPase